MTDLLTYRVSIGRRCAIIARTVPGVRKVVNIGMQISVRLLKGESARWTTLCFLSS